MYKQIKLFDGTIVSDQIKRMQDNATIPFNTANIDYQAYLKWIEGCEQQFNPETHEMVWVKTSDGNTPLPADE